MMKGCYVMKSVQSGNGKHKKQNSKLRAENIKRGTDLLHGPVLQFGGYEDD